MKNFSKSKCLFRRHVKKNEKYATNIKRVCVCVCVCPVGKGADNKMDSRQGSSFVVPTIPCPLPRSGEASTLRAVRCHGSHLTENTCVR